MATLEENLTTAADAAKNLGDWLDDREVYITKDVHRAIAMLHSSLVDAMNKVQSGEMEQALDIMRPTEVLAGVIEYVVMYSPDERMGEEVKDFATRAFLTASTARHQLGW